MVLCDTNGGTLPDEVERIVGEVARVIPGDRLGIHAHNDTGNAVANSLAAVRAGARQMQGTLNGLGERCGNANLVTLIPTLALKAELAERFETGITPEALREITHISRAFDELLNRAPDRHAPYVGASAFATKAGIHASALAKDPRTYEHVPPESVGNTRAVLVSDQAGRSNLLAELDRLGVEAKPDDPRLSFLLDEVKAREAQGYAYEAADASFELLARGVLGGVPAFFDVESFHVSVERKFVAPGAPIRPRRRWSRSASARSASFPRPKAMAPSTRSISRCARTSASIRATSRTSSCSTTGCGCSRAAPTR